jgi:hypothetical protein
MYPDPFPDELLTMLQPGKRVRVPPQFNKLSRSPLLHIRAIVDDEYIVYRTWAIHRRHWVYDAEWSYWFWLLWEDGHLLPA